MNMGARNRKMKNQNYPKMTTSLPSFIDSEQNVSDNFANNFSTSNCCDSNNYIKQNQIIINKDNNNEIIKNKLKNFSSQWKNLMIRSIFGFIMISGFILMIYGGPIMLIIVILIAQIKCYDEIITIGFQIHKIPNSNCFRKLAWYFSFAVNYFFFGEIFFNFINIKIKNEYDILYILIKYHRIISFLLYFIGLVIFVISLKKQYYRKQFSLFAWIHLAFLVCVVQCYLHIQNIFEGIIWFIIPVAMITCNDIMAYICGFFFGRTPLIKLSPKKTWEGFIGGGIGTIIFGIILSAILCESKFLTCSMDYWKYGLGQISMDCEPSYLFIKKEYSIFQNKIMIYPFIMHSIVLGIVSSIIGPFGGFLASGFKRAFKVKDFGDSIPGHGGFMDRCDSQCLMGTFVNVYISSFIIKSSTAKILNEILTLKYDQQLFILNELKQYLEKT
ncbi:phosphatidate cytidylyltransferase, photoreceptor-specific-like [Condylostylus longicornis]|uniref:phosphatidate cytidylyltransferase, photoreceptor-specific-like n=1 Tax=Condylostylus longicornis TaxID=2530218 RepID=UPI00244DF2C5|nr:phosphatidate cytidylyltransferase, photoreceptor-specific-like [Condylostylus longicornis]